MSDDRGTRLARQGLLIAGLALAHVVSAVLMLRLGAVHEMVAVVWPGLPLAAIRRFGYGVWPGIALGGLIHSSVLHGRPVTEGLGISLGDTIEALLGAWLLALAGFDDALERARDVFVFVLVAAGVSMLSATIGVGTLWLHAVVPPAAFGAAWLVWWIADAMGNLIVAAMLLTWLARTATPPSPRRWIEFGALLAVTAALGSIVLAGWPEIGFATYLHSYVIFTALIWAALRFGPRGATAALFVVSTVAIAGTARQHGPFVRPTVAESMLNLELFLGIVVVSTLVLAAVARERERAAAARDEFMAVAAHELRTPLTALRLQIEALLRSEARPSSGPSTSRPAQVRRAARQVDRLERLVDALLDVQRVDRAWEPPRDHEPIDLAALVRDVADRYSGALSLKSCALEVRADTPVYARCDGFSVEQVVTNLLTNACTFGAGKPITLSVSRVDGAARIAVQDRGIGIAAADQARIFDRFARAAPAAHYGGLGLGLYIVRQIVAAHGGSIRVESAPGEGATFITEFPAAPARDRADRGDEAPS